MTEKPPGIRRSKSPCGNGGEHNPDCFDPACQFDASVDPIAESDAVMTLAECLRRAFWNPDNGGQWPAIAAEILASGWYAKARADAWDEGAEFMYLYDRGELYPEPTNPYRQDAP